MSGVPATESDLNLRDAEPSDLDAVVVIEEISFGPPWSRRQFVDEIGAPFSRFLVAHRDNALVGYVIWRHILDEVQIFNIAVHPSLRRGGLGRLLIGRAIDAARAGGARVVTLEVHASNGVAIAFYGVLGFVEVGRRPNYYGRGEAGLLLELTL